MAEIAGFGELIEPGVTGVEVEIDVVGVEGVGGPGVGVGDCTLFISSLDKASATSFTAPRT